MHYFNKAIITHITSTPTHETLKTLQTELNNNSMSITLDATYNGHLIITMAPIEYATKNSLDLPPPTNPGKWPKITIDMTGP